MIDAGMQRNTCYSLIMRQMLANGTDDDHNGWFDFQDPDPESDAALDADDGSSTHRRRHGTQNWRHLKEFESGDAADQEAWDMAVQYVNMSRSGWRVESQGVFVKGYGSSGSTSVPDNDGTDEPGGMAEDDLGDGHPNDGDDDVLNFQILSVTDSYPTPEV
jgi:hypothetical protein